MPERKAWTSDEDKALKQIVSTGVTKWTLVAKILESQYQIFGRTGKQCRQRWFNQLNPDISSQNWSIQQQNLLIQLHKKLGNSWSKISQQFKGRTDNQIKNHFNSNIRKAFRRLNRHISSIKSRKQLTIKVLTKLLTVSEDKFDKKLKLSEDVIETAIEIKNKLLQLALDIDENKQDTNQMNKIVIDISSFSKNCKRNKKVSTKIKDKYIEQQQSINYDESSQQIKKNIKNNGKFKKVNKKEQTVKSNNLHEQLKEQSFERMKLRSSQVQSNSASIVNKIQTSSISLRSSYGQSVDQISPLRRRSSSRSSNSIFGGSGRQRYSDFDYLPRAAGFNFTESENLNNFNMFQYPPESLLQRLD